LPINDEETIEILKSLIKIDSSNPDVGNGPGEAEIAKEIESLLRKAGLEVEIQRVKGDRCNVIGVLRGNGSGRRLMLNGHMDTVGVENMEVEPFNPLLKDGLIYGRGSCDMKGGLAAMISAAKTLASSGPRLRGDIYFAAVVDEEYDSIGSEKVLDGYPVDGVIVCEPTEMKVGVAHMGFAWIEIEAIGKAAHGSVVEEGQDAIVDMARIIEEMETLETRSGHKSHVLLGAPKFHTSKILGGRDWSVVPDRCKLMVERRTLPGESSADILEETREAISRARARFPKVRAESRLIFERAPLETPQDADVVQVLAKAVEAVSGSEPRLAGLPYWSDASIFSARGRIPSVLFGPGSIRHAHSAIEYVPMEEVKTSARVLADAAVRFCETAGS
jgi:acetylornithine deacetylase